MSLSRPWLALVLALFCLPLFIGLGREDIRDDEAIYSFAVERILETGDWLEPKSIPNETWAFLEKPPLKFWIVAAPIRFGLLPHDEFGIRFWDALFGALSFVYVFLIGSRLLSAVLWRCRRSACCSDTTRSSSFTVSAATTWRRRWCWPTVAGCFIFWPGPHPGARRRAPLMRSRPACSSCWAS